MAKLLVRDGKLVLRPDGRLALDCDPDCCGPTECQWFGRFEPCGVVTPDPACAFPPGKGELFVCHQTPCTNGSPWRFLQDVQRPTPVIPVLRWMGRCWNWIEDVQRPAIPEGADVVEDGTIECVGQTCAECPDADVEYAVAEPCNPAYNGPPVYYCPAGLPFDCNVLNPSIAVPGQGWPNECFEFNRSAATVPVPANTPAIYIPPGTYPQRTCCTCNPACVRTARNFQDQCAGDYQLSCCCGDLTNAVVVYGGQNVFDGWTSGFGGPYRNSVTVETWSGTSNATGQHRTVRTIYNEQGGIEGVDIDVTEDIPPFAPSCPLQVFPNWAFYQCEHPCQGSGSFSPPQLTHTCDRYDFSVAWNCAPNTQMFPGTAATSTAFARLIGMVAQPGCESTNCGGGFAFSQGSDNGGIVVRGGGSRVTDPAVAAWMQQNLGGCRGCGESENPL